MKVQKNMPCRFCGKSSVKKVFDRTNNSDKKDPALFTCTNSGFGKHGEIVRCLNCDIYYVNDATDQNEITSYYEVCDDPIYFSEQKAREKTFNHYLDSLENIFKRKGRLLDIGTNTGLFMKVARDRGWEVFGVEPSKSSVAFAKKTYHLDIVNSDYKKSLFQENYFDVICMWDVIEHFNDPVKEIEKVYYHLRPGGMFVFSTVDPTSRLARIMGTNWPWYMEMHRIFLSEKSAKYYLEEVGFENVTFKAHWRFLSSKYFASRLAAVSKPLSKFLEALLSKSAIGKISIPYYANDLYNCFCTKPLD